MTDFPLNAPIIILFRIIGRMSKTCSGLNSLSFLISLSELRMSSLFFLLLHPKKELLHSAS